MCISCRSKIPVISTSILVSNMLVQATHPMMSLAFTIDTTDRTMLINKQLHAHALYVTRSAWVQHPDVIHIHTCTHTQHIHTRIPIHLLTNTHTSETENLRLASPVISAAFLCDNCTTSNLSTPVNITFTLSPGDQVCLVTQ